MRLLMYELLIDTSSCASQKGTKASQARQMPRQTPKEDYQLDPEDDNAGTKAQRYKNRGT